MCRGQGELPADGRRCRLLLLADRLGAQMARKPTFSEALEYHEKPTPGKTAIRSTKPTATQADLALAYSPGVALPCLEIAANPDDAYQYTAKGNLVAVVTNGTAVLGLGNIGALAGKPVMEGKATSSSSSPISMSSISRSAPSLRKM